MNAKDIYLEFAAVGTPAGPALILDDHAALELITRAQQAGLAISEIEMVRPADLAHVDPLPRRMLRDAERFSSWNQARSFVEMLAGRGLYFLVAIESPWSTRLARLRSFVRMLVRDNTATRMPP